MENSIWKMKLWMWIFLKKLWSTIDRSHQLEGIEANHEKEKLEWRSPEEIHRVLTAHSFFFSVSNPQSNGFDNEHKDTTKKPNSIQIWMLPIKNVKIFGQEL